MDRSWPAPTTTGGLQKPEGRKLLHQALELMKPMRRNFGRLLFGTFRMGYSYYYLDQEGRALRYFEKALEARDDPTRTPWN